MKSVNWLLVLVSVVCLTSCATTFGQLFDENLQTRIERQNIQQYDYQMYQARSYHRHREVAPIPPGQTAMVLTESKREDEIIDDFGYKNGFETILINDSRHDLRVDITDSHGQHFSFWVPPLRQIRDPESGVRVMTPGSTIIKLETGQHLVRAYRSWDNVPWVSTTMNVYSDQIYHVAGFGDYYGGRRFFGN